jgi:hypothetical protein
MIIFMPMGIDINHKNNHQPTKLDEKSLFSVKLTRPTLPSYLPNLH